MAIGDSIGSARTAGLMRRINAIEYRGSTTYSSVSNINNGLTAPGSTQYDLIATNGTGVLAFDDRGAGLELDLFDTSGTYQSTVITAATLGLDNLDEPRGLSATDSSIFIGHGTVASSTESVKEYNYSGTLLATKNYTVGVTEHINVLGSSKVGGVSRCLVTIKSSGNPHIVDIIIAGSVDHTLTSGFDNGSAPQGCMDSDGNVYIIGLVSSTATIKQFDSSGDFVSNYDNSSLFPNTTTAGVGLLFDSYGVLTLTDIDIAGAEAAPFEYNFLNERLTNPIGLDRGNSGFIELSGDFYFRNGTALLKISTTTNMTTWYQYPKPSVDTGKITLGSVDQGNTIPVDTALEGLRPHYFELRDMRNAIETVCVNYENPATNNAYTLTAGADNIFRLAIDSGQDDWTTATVTHGDRIREDYYSDIESVLTQLELSALV